MQPNNSQLTYIKKNKNKRDRLFVLAGYTNKICFEEICCWKLEDALKLFIDKHGIEPHYVAGPFRRARVIKKINKLSLSSSMKEGTYMGWKVKYVPLKDPADCAMIIFISKLNNNALKRPSKPIVIHIKEIERS